MMLRGVLLVAALILSSCSSPPKPATTALRLQVTKDASVLDEAAVTIDDEYVGELKKVRQRGVALPPGLHRVTIQLPGYFPFDVEVEAEEAEEAEGAERPTLNIEVEMVPIPD